MSSKLCTACQQVKPRTEFAPDDFVPDGHSKTCRTCAALARAGIPKTSVSAKAPAAPRPETKSSDHYQKREAARARVEDRPNLSIAPINKYWPSPKPAAVRSRLLAALDPDDGRTIDEVWQAVRFWTRDTIAEGLEELREVGAAFRGDEKWFGKA
jgi:hypothetical protein